MNKKEGLEKAKAAENADSRRYEWKRKTQRIRRRKKKKKKNSVYCHLLYENSGDSKVSTKTLFDICLRIAHGCIYSESLRTRSFETTCK